MSIPDQLVHVYRNGIRVAASTCSTGKPGHRTPTGVFQILQKDKHHRSSTYSNAPMPNMNRLTWSGIALHAGNLPGYPASHGCVRLPMQFSELLFDVTRKGMTVVIADESSQPASVSHPGMVLGDYARREFAAVDTALVADQYAAAHDDKPPVTSVVVSSRDRSVTVLEDGRVVAKGKASISGGEAHRRECLYPDRRPQGRRQPHLVERRLWQDRPRGHLEGPAPHHRRPAGARADPQAHAERHDGGDDRPVELAIAPRQRLHHHRRRLLTPSKQGARP